MDSSMTHFWWTYDLIQLNIGWCQLIIFLSTESWSKPKDCLKSNVLLSSAMTSLLGFFKITKYLLFIKSHFVSPLNFLFWILRVGFFFSDWITWSEQSQEYLVNMKVGLFLNLSSVYIVLKIVPSILRSRFFVLNSFCCIIFVRQLGFLH